MLYLITIYKQQKLEYVSSRTLIKIISILWLEHDFNLIYGKWERHGMYKQLHFHGIFDIPDNIQYSQYTNFGNYKLDFKQIRKPLLKNIKIIKTYIDKHWNSYNNTQLDTQTANYYNNHYGFDKYTCQRLLISRKKVKTNVSKVLPRSMERSSV